MSDAKLHLNDAHDYLKRVIVILHTMERQEKGKLVAVLEHLSAYICSTREDIAALRPTDAGSDMFSSASDHLEEILTETAAATNAIMGAAEAIESACAGIPENSKAAIYDATTKIYEACAFQDITGQRITKIVRALQHIETKLAALNAACALPDDLPAATPAKPAEGDAALLNGPQLATDARSQDDIDRLFASVG